MISDPENAATGALAATPEAALNKRLWVTKAARLSTSWLST
jgi:hypothetical protein